MPSHLLWWIHVLPVAFYTYEHGRRGAAATVGLSALLIVLGERAFGGGYGTSATWETAISLMVALVFTNLLVAAFAIYARTMTQRYQLLFEGVTLGVLRVDRDGRIRDANSGAENFLRLPVSEMAGRLLDRVLRAPDLPSLEALAARHAAPRVHDRHRTPRRARPPDPRDGPVHGGAPGAEAPADVEDRRPGRGPGRRPWRRRSSRSSST